MRHQNNPREEEELYCNCGGRAKKDAREGEVADLMVSAASAGIGRYRAALP